MSEDRALQVVHAQLAWEFAYSNPEVTVSPGLAAVKTTTYRHDIAPGRKAPPGKIAVYATPTPHTRSTSVAWANVKRIEYDNDRIALIDDHDYLGNERRKELFAFRYSRREYREQVEGGVLRTRLGKAENRTRGEQLELIAALIILCPNVSSQFRNVAVAEIGSPTKLNEIAVHGANAIVRRASVERITNQVVLAKVATEDCDRGVRIAALRLLSDQTVLTKVATEAHDPIEGCAAVERITNPSALALIARNNQEINGNIRAAAIKKIGDPELLTQVAIEGETSSGTVAVEKVSDQALLARIAIEARSGVVRRDAVKKVTDDVILAKAALEDPFWQCRRVAVSKLNDQNILGKIALQDEEAQVRLAAIGKVTNQTVLAKVADTHADPRVRCAAVEKLTDQALLARLAIEDEGVCRTAVFMLTDRTLLKVVADSAKNPNVQAIARRKVTETR